ncbi:APC family permease [Alicyclobacillus acidiphilus]|uniref:APC family permease n=1 Tax=Alicyclobacillus acidiphilus TaxID=182455 RepID=UPI00083186E3|nr:APC family permease [Alicyclobacillus acidiphilus]
MKGDSKQRLKRGLNFWDLLMVSMGGIIGSGWLFGSLQGASLAGPAVMLSWVIGGIAVILLALTFAELSGIFPEAGALVRYPQYSHGTFVSYIMGWAMILGFASTPPIEAESAVQFANYYIPGLYAKGALTHEGLIVAALLMLVFFLLNYFGVMVFAKTNTFWTALKILIPVVTIVLLLISSFHPSNFTSAGGFAPDGSSAIFSAIPLGGIVYAYLGFEQAMDMAGEAKNPQRDVPRAVVLSVVIGIVLYAALQFAWIVSMPKAQLVHGWSGINFSSPFANLVATLGFGSWASILFLDAIWSPSGTGNVFVASTGRIIYAMSKNRYFPKIFTWVHPRTGVPVWAMVMTIIVGYVFLAPFPSWSSLVGIVSSATVLVYIIGPISTGALRKTAPDLNRPFKLAGLNIVGPLGFIAATLIIYWSGWKTDSVLLIAMLAGVVLYAYGASSFAEDTRPYGWKSIKAGIWLVVYLIVLLLMTYFGAKNFGAPHQLIKYPYDVIVLAVVSLIFYYWGIHSGIVTDELLTLKNESQAADEEIA